MQSSQTSALLQIACKKSHLKRDFSFQFVKDASMPVVHVLFAAGIADDVILSIERDHPLFNDTILHISLVWYCTKKSS